MSECDCDDLGEQAKIVLPRHRNPRDSDGGPNHWELWLRDPDGSTVVSPARTDQRMEIGNLSIAEDEKRRSQHESIGSPGHARLHRRREIAGCHFSRREI